jgi:hypothetical protein
MRVLEHGSFGVINVARLRLTLDIRRLLGPCLQLWYPSRGHHGHTEEP